MFTLVIGDKNLSSWSLRPWLVLRRYGFEFREIKLALDTPEFKAQISRYSGAHRVPVLIDDEVLVWDSLAIVEYLNEKVGGRAWPADAAARARARSVSAEMHSGFAALRQTWSMRALGTNRDVPLTPAAAQDVARIEEIWTECRKQYGASGPWLFGEYSIADAMYAPVVLRFNHYGATLSATGAAYMRQTLQDPHLQQWIAEAAQELASR
jgi:glutathione S-transferase